MVTRGTAPMCGAALLAHSGTTDPCGGDGSQRGIDGAAARHGIAGPSDPGKGLRYPTPSPVPGAACRPGSRPGGSVQLIRAAGSWASWAGPPRSQRAVAVGSTTGLPPSNRPAYAAVGQADRGTCGHVLA